MAQHPAEVRGSWGGEGDRRAWPPWRGDEALQRWRGGNRGGGGRGQEKEKRTLCGWQRNVMKERMTRKQRRYERALEGKAEEGQRRRLREEKQDIEEGRERAGQGETVCVKSVQM